MATVNFLYRSTKSEAPLNIRLLYRINDPSLNDGYSDVVLGAKTQIKVTRAYWDSTHKKHLKDIKDVDQRNQYNDINWKLSKLENHLLAVFEKKDPRTIDKNWLKTEVSNYYNPIDSDPLKDIPKDLVGYIDFYLDYKKSEISPKSVRRINVTKHKMERLQEKMGKPILIKEINEDFKKEFQDYSTLERYSQNTQQRELVFVCLQRSWTFQ